MAYIGPLPAETFTSFATQEFSTSATTSYTLDHPVTNENELALFINNVRQQPGSGKAYTATGTALTLSAATASTDTMYAVFLGRALQTVNPADASVGTSQLAATSVTAAKLNNDIISGTTALAETPADTDELLVSDAGTLKRVDFSHLKGGGMWEFISASTISSSTAQVDFTTLSTTFEDFCFSVQNLHPVDDEPRIYGRVFTGTGGSQAVVTGSNYGFAEIMRNETTVTDNNNSQDHMRFSHQVGNDTGESVSSEIFLYNPHSTVHHKLFKAHTVLMNSSNLVSIDNLANKYKATTAVTGVRFYFQAGNILSGKISLYGRKNS